MAGSLVRGYDSSGQLRYQRDLVAGRHAEDAHLLAGGLAHPVPVEAGRRSRALRDEGVRTGPHAPVYLRPGARHLLALEHGGEIDHGRLGATARTAAAVV